MIDDQTLHVVAAVLRRPNGEVLLARRPSGNEDAGFWEFPGGKREPGESSIEALRRELREELDLQIGEMRPLIRIPQQQPHRRLLLEVWMVEVAADLQPVALLGQALRWRLPDRIDPFQMPVADRPALATLCQPDLYAISPDLPDDDDSVVRLLSGVSAMGRTGVARLQLRMPQLSSARRATVLAQAKARFSGELLCNARDTTDLRLAAEADVGVHLSHALLLRLQQRPEGIATVMASVHDLHSVRHAETLALNAVVLGPVRPTRTHPEATAIGWDGFVALRQHSSLPIYALGGLAPEDVSCARHHGAQGVAGIRCFAWENCP